jgi:glycosyltransferase involved in cell wall biosynthesis
MPPIAPTILGSCGFPSSFPVYNERTVVERSLAQVLAAPLSENMDRELIVVGDCSTDGTAAILDRMAPKNPVSVWSARP